RLRRRGAFRASPRSHRDIATPACCSPPIVPCAAGARTNSGRSATEPPKTPTWRSPCAWDRSASSVAPRYTRAMPSFDFSDEEKQLMDTAREFARKEIVPVAAELDEH